jgi:gentisate 1,2-dioxygenase
MHSSRFPGYRRGMSTSLPHIQSLEQLYEVLPAKHYEPLWTIEGALTPAPATRMVPHLWRYEEAKRLILDAGELISAEAADRRVLAFKNPGTAAHEIARTTDTLWAAIQLVLPGEVAPPHRHTASALRYIVEGSGAYTVVDGRRIDMEAGDVVLTPNWSWHEHGHAGEGPMLWLDGLDLPMVNTLHLIFTEHGDSSTAMAPSSGPARNLVWKLADVRAELERRRTEPADPHDDVVFEYGAPALTTLSAWMQLLRPGVETRPHRHTNSVVYHVVEGRGWSDVGGSRLEWNAGDTFALPYWVEHRHANPTAEDALLFSFSDAPALAALGLLREASR